MANLPKFTNQPSDAEANDFLSKVDESGSVIKGLNSEDENQVRKCMSKADKLIEKVEAEKSEKKNKDKDDDSKDLPITKTGFSKTVINKDAYKNETTGPHHPNGQPINQNAFMAALEADANERATRRKEREKIAGPLKEKGNAEFKQGNYEEAIKYYDQAIEQVRDNSLLYTNRAQAKIKLKKYSEALSDCDWALRAWQNNMKAYVHQGHAQLALKEFDKARESYKMILTIDSKKEGIVKDYLSQVDREEQASKEEAKAAELFETGNDVAQGVVDLLTRINRKDELPLYYAGGFRVITELLFDTDSQTLFRTKNGLRLPEEHPLLSRLLSCSMASLTKEERDVVTASLDMMCSACKKNETSQQQLLGLPKFAFQLQSILELKLKGQGRLLRTSCLNLMYEISLTEAGRALLVQHMDIGRLIPTLFPLMVKPSSGYASTAAALLNNIALDKRSKALVRGNIEETILPAFEGLLRHNQTTPSIVGVASSTATNLATDVTIRNKMAAKTSLWSVVSGLMVAYTESRLTEPLENLLGLLMNISTGVEPSALKQLDSDVVSACMVTLAPPDGITPSQTVVARALAVISNVLAFNELSMAFFGREDRAIALFEYMKSDDPQIYRSALRCMTTLTQASESIRQQVADHKGTSALLNLLTNDDEAVVGNAALCLSHLCQIPKVCAKLTKTNVIQKLLTVARDGRKSAVQSNCAILIGKLATGDPRHLERLRELDGLGILHDCMKYIK